MDYIARQKIYRQDIGLVAQDDQKPLRVSDVQFGMIIDTRFIRLGLVLVDSTQKLVVLTLLGTF